MVTKQPRWAPDPETYAARKPATNDTYREVPDREPEVRDTGVWWTEVDTARMLPSDTESAWRRLRASVPELVWNAARLEGNSFTLPEVRTLLAGVTVGGHSAEDELQVLTLSEAYGALRDLVGYGRFHIDKSTSDRLNRIAARHETPDAGRFRGEGTLRRNGSELLRARFATLQERLAGTDDPRLQALIYFCSAARTRFYAGGNGRTALLMMTGILISNGFDAISIPGARRLELDHALDTLDTTDEATELMALLVDCAAPGLADANENSFATATETRSQPNENSFARQGPHAGRRERSSRTSRSTD